MSQSEPQVLSRLDLIAALPDPPTVSDTTLTHTAPSDPPLIQSHASTDGVDVVLTAVLSSAFIAALIAAGINIWLTRRRSREEERNRLRISFAEAFAAYTAYKELPYAIRRRRADAPGEERVRLSEALRKVQSDLAYHIAWTAAESETVGRAYANLIQKLRATAGEAMHQAWTAEPVNSDAAMNITSDVIDLSELASQEAVYMEAVRNHLRRLSPWWAP